ncbi:MAG: hypoxanthine phosphoribosyltransferase [Gemmatimonadota bacterium]|nr:hypoxanthine phosphoribosyltransferase [Gemmatimonadota bacterium]MDH3421417.1 hypoxanthine phosphoribosyltransferase [Gemmatimonadota bacterium]
MTPQPKPGKVVYSAEQISTRVQELAADISSAYSEDDRLLILGLLKGSFIFMADLVREITLPHHVDFLVASSYGAGKQSSGDVRLLHDPESPLAGRAVIVVEDIVDSGTTLEGVLPRLRAREPASLDVCTLLHKRLTPLDPEPRWVGFDAPNDFLVGYGLDHAEDFRHLPYIASL